MKATMLPLVAECFSNRYSSDVVLQSDMAVPKRGLSPWAIAAIVIGVLPICCCGGLFMTGMLGSIFSSREFKDELEREAAKQQSNQGNSGPPPSTTKSAPVVKPIVLSAESLIQEVDDNALRTKEKYFGRVLEVTGVVASVDEFAGQLVILVSPKADSFQYVRVEVPERLRSEATKLHKGESIRIAGRYEGDIMGSPQLKME